MLIGFSWTRAAVVRPMLALRSVESDTLEFDAGTAGMLYWLANDIPTQSDMQIKAGGAVSGSLMVSEGATSGVLDLRPLGGGTRHFHAVLEVAGIFSDVVTEQIVLPATLSGAAFANVTATSATLSVTTDAGEGELFVAVYPSGANPGAAEIKSGFGAAFAASLPASGVGGKTFTAEGLTGGRTYRAFFVQNNGLDSLIAQTPEFTTTSQGVTLNEVLFPANSRLDLSVNNVPASADAVTIAMRVRFKTTASDSFMIGSGFDSYLRRNASGSLRARFENVAGAALIDQGHGVSGNYPLDSQVSMLISVSRTQARKVFDGITASLLSYADAGSPVRLPRYVNDITGTYSTDDSITVSGLWIGTGWIDPAANYPAFFEVDGTPTADMLAGNPIAGLAPVFAESGPATKWNARPGMTGTAKDV